MQTNSMNTVWQMRAKHTKRSADFQRFLYINNTVSYKIIRAISSPEIRGFRSAGIRGLCELECMRFGHPDR